MISTNLNSMNKTIDSDTKLPKTKTLRRLLKLMSPYKKKVIFACICVILVNGAQLMKPYILKLVIDDFLTKNVAQKGLYSITTMGILYFVVVALSGFFSIAQVILITSLKF